MSANTHVSPAELTRPGAAARSGRSFDRASVRVAHIGLGAFHRAHQAWYTDVSDDANEWGIRAFSGRSPHAAEELAAQDGLYALIERSGDGDEITLVDSVVDAVDGARVDRLVETLAAPATSLVTLTITESGYALDAQHRPDLTRDDVAADVAWLRNNLGSADFDFSDAPRTALARVLVGLEGRRRAGAEPLSVVSCDNLPSNGELTQTALRSLAELASAPETLAYLDEHISFVATSVDRITPKTTREDIAVVQATTGWKDRTPVVTEPFRDWVLSGEFRAGRPAWERAGAQFVDDVEPFERRKLWLLNGAHSLLAYAGAARGHATVAAAIADATVRSWVEEFWTEAVRHLPEKQLDLDGYRAALLDRFDNGRIQHLLEQIGQDGTTKLRVRVAPVLLAERGAGNAADASVRTLGAWIALARAGRLPADRIGSALQDAAQLPGEAAIVALLGLIDPRLVEDPAVVTAVSRAAADFAVA